MTKLKSILSTFLLSLGFIVLSANGAEINEMITTIILINGEAHLVDIAPDGELLVSYGKVPDYFSSTLSHEDIVDRSIAILESNRKSRYDLIRFVSFGIETHMLNEYAVDYIREMSSKMNTSEGQIVITAGVTGSKDEMQKAQQIVDLLIDFGADPDRIKIIKKQYLGDEPNQFIKMEYQPNLVYP